MPTLKAHRDDRRCVTVLTIELEDRELARNHLVLPMVDGPVEALAAYGLHCLEVLMAETVEERVRRIHNF